MTHSAAANPDQPNLQSRPTPLTPRLSPAVIGSPAALPADAQQQIRDLIGPRPYRFLGELASTWAVIAIAIAIAEFSNSWWATALAVIVIGTRQMVLGLLLHEQVHSLGLRGKWADSIVNALAVYPLLVTTVEDYAEVHLRHHRHFMTPRDPDFLRKSGPEWRFPQSLSGLLGIAARDLLALNLIKLIKGKTAPAGAAEFRRAHPSPRWLRPAWFALLAIGVTALGAWPEFLLYWILPLLTVAQLCVRWIAVLEHEYELEGSSVNDTTPLVSMRWYEKLLVPDLNFAMHVYHHNHPGISFSQLPKAHQIYQQHGLVDQSAVFKSGLSYLRYLCGSSQR